MMNCLTVTELVRGGTGIWTQGDRDSNPMLSSTPSAQGRRFSKCGPRSAVSAAPENL